MQKAINYVKGDVRVLVKCRYPERIINICAKNAVEFRALSRAEEGTYMTVSIAGYRKLRELSEESGMFTVKAVGRKGVPFFLWRIRKRYILLFGMALCFAAVWISSFFIWQIDVMGNETVSETRIIACLKKLGVSVGKSTFSVKQECLQNELLLMMPELSWIALNTHGSRIEVIVREEIKKPEIIDPHEGTVVYAKKAGIITDMTVRAGLALVSEGDTVAAGDVLITGAVPGAKSGVRFLNADADIRARTWYEITLKMPLNMTEKDYTGKKLTRRAVILGGKRINLYFSGGKPYEHYDKITVYDPLEISGGTVLPFTAITETYEEYEPVSSEISEETAEAILKSRLLAMLQEKIGDGAAVKTEFSKSLENGVLSVTLRAECTEPIAGERALSESEIAEEEAKARAENNKNDTQ